MPSATTETDVEIAVHVPPRRTVDAAMFAIVAVGVALRATQYAASTSLWLDEIALVKGIVTSDVVSLLTRPLPFDQVAPKGFLVAQKLVVGVFGPSDYALRAIPFASSMIALLFFSLLARRVLAPVGALAATAIFATAAPFVAFAGVVKQYSTDVCVAVVLTWLAYDLLAHPVTERRAWRTAAAGAVLLWFSQPAVLLIAALACPLILWMSAHSAEARRRHVVVVVGVWAASAMAVTASALATMGPGTMEYMRTFWAAGFPPASLRSVIESRWPWPNVEALFGSGPASQASLTWPFSPMYPVLAGIGLGQLWKRDHRVGVLLLAPVILTLAAAVVGQYPFRDRLILFLVPLAIIAIAVALTNVHRAVASFSTPAAALAVTALVLPTVVPVAKLPPPYRVEDVKNVLEQVQTQRQSGDDIYVYYGAAPVMSVYDSVLGLSRRAYLVGGCHRGDTRGYLHELDTFRGNPRVWVILTHSLLVYREREDILSYLDTIGTRLDYVRVDSRAIGRALSPAEAVLYDLSRAPRLASMSAESFVPTGRVGLDSRLPCTNGPQAMIPSDFECTQPPNMRCTRRPLEGS
jgi:hypothetical protein